MVPSVTRCRCRRRRCGQAAIFLSITTERKIWYKIHQITTIFEKKYLLPSKSLFGCTINARAVKQQQQQIDGMALFNRLANVCDLTMPNKETYN